MSQSSPCGIPGRICPGVDASSRICGEYLKLDFDSAGVLRSARLHYPENFSFAYDVVDRLAQKDPSRRAMLWIGRDGEEKMFTFRDMSELSMRAANYLAHSGIRKGDRVVLALRRNWQFWVIFLACSRIGAVCALVNNQLLEADFKYRFDKLHASAVFCSAMDKTVESAGAAAGRTPDIRLRISTFGARNNWHDFDAEFMNFPPDYPRPADHRASDPLLIFFSSGTTGFPKAIVHSHTYPLGHIMTAGWWQNVNPDGLHWTISDTGWAKSMWGKLFGQWLCEAAVFVYDFDRFHAAELMGMFRKYHITTFCAPATMFRFFIKEGLEEYDFSSLEHVGMAGEALNPEVMNRFARQTGHVIHEGFGQSETPVVIGNGTGITPKPGSMGKPNPVFQVALLDSSGHEVRQGETGEICIHAQPGEIPGLLTGYYGDEESFRQVWHDGYYHLGDTAWQDGDGYYWYVGRVDDVIKSSGYRIGPFEIESCLMELPYILECAVVGAPDPVRGQVVKAYIVLTRGKTSSPELVREIQEYVKTHTAPYKYPRAVEFMESLPKTVSGKIIRKALRELARKE